MDKKSNEPWFSDEWFWQTYGAIMFDEERLSRTSDEVDRILKLTGLSPESEILDCCCGMGRHSMEMAVRGASVTGVDLSEGYLAKAAETARSRDLNIDWVRMDVRDMKYNNRFDGIINMFTSFGYFEDPEDDLILLRNIHSALKEGGTFFIEIMGKEILARDFEERVWFERGDTKIMLEYSVDLNWTELHNRWLFLEGEKLTEYRFSHRIFSALEMAQLMARAGFASIDIYGGFDGSPYDHKASHLILTGRK